MRVCRTGNKLLINGTNGDNRQPILVSSTLKDIYLKRGSKFEPKVEVKPRSYPHAEFCTTLEKGSEQIYEQIYDELIKLLKTMKPVSS
ncbi:MAG: hypothetical protein WC533_03500 [Candidatus Pacearchaeota archaeon]